MKWFETSDIGIDLGTASVLVFVKGKGIVLREPSVVALDKSTGRMVAVGDEARHMIGRTPGNIVAIRPLRDGVISNYDVTEKMLFYFLKKIIGRRFFFKPRLVVCVPSGVTEVEKRSVKQASEGAGARHTMLIEEPIAAAIGAGIDIGAPYGSMVLDIGGGTTDVAVISLGSSVVSESIKCAGDKMDEAIVRYMRKKHNLLIGERTAEEMKINIGTAYPRKEDVYMDITGRNLISGLPRTVRIAGNEMIEALEEPIQLITDAVHSTLERTPPELAADVSENGICMTGGGSLLFGLDRYLSERVKIPCYVAEDAMSCVAIGTGKALENYDKNSFAYNAITEYRRGDYLNV
ncbi:rod shape-determining protein MreB [Christensenella sp. MSJ-20]|uniref:rod shape-determining protein MreB n=1 Tax=Christensenella sp. MSJ-20 TaxID=2841518 RepID=UPI000D7B1010|nr:MAG: rod shape-determining protein [Bacillota bacterium]QWT55042.1 rod shape-determining protein MreB [Christensenella sp. MSJ-20]